MRAFVVGATQRAALEIYVFDVAVNVDDDTFPGELNDQALVVYDTERAGALLVDAANSADDDGDRELRDALTALTARVWRSGR